MSKPTKDIRQNIAAMSALLVMLALGALLFTGTKSEMEIAPDDMQAIHAFLETQVGQAPVAGLGPALDASNPFAGVDYAYKLDAANRVMLFGDHDHDVVTPPIPNLIQGLPMVVVTTPSGTPGGPAEVVGVRIPIETLKTALYLESDRVQLNGTELVVSGHDWDLDSENAEAFESLVPAILTTQDPARIHSTLALASDVDLDLRAMRNAFVQQARYRMPGRAFNNVVWGSLDEYTVVHSTGDLRVTGESSGAGILVVDGDLEVDGSFTWHGLVLVTGHLRIDGAEDGARLYGSTLVGGQSNTETAIGGTARIQYSSDALARLNDLSPYTVYSWREI